MCILQPYWCITVYSREKTRILLFPVSLPSHPSAVPYDPRAIVWHSDARQTAQTSSRWLFTTLQCPTTTSSHRALPWPTAPQNRPTQAAAGAPDPAVTTQKARGPAGWAGGTRRPGRERQQHAQGQQSNPAGDGQGGQLACTSRLCPGRALAPAYVRATLSVAVDVKWCTEDHRNPEQS